MTDKQTAPRTDATTQTYLPWVDVIRACAIIGVILCHVVDTFMASPAAETPQANLWIELFKALSRPSVPLFVMVTGFLLLPVRTDSVEFYRKRLTRVLCPFLLWSAVYSVLPWIFSFFSDGVRLIHIFFPYYGNDFPGWQDALKDVLLIPFNFNNTTYPLWYVYMLIGLYLFMPVFSAWLERAKPKEFRIFLAIWAFSLFIPYLRTFVTTYFWGAAAWNEFGMFYYFSGFIGYLLVAYIVKRSPDVAFRGRSWMLVLVFILAYAMTYIGYHYMMSDPAVTEEGMELFFLFCTPNVVLMTIVLFFLLRRVTVSSPMLVSCLRTLSRCGFGIYMVHYLFVGPLEACIGWLCLPAFVHIPLVTALVFGVSWLVAHALGKTAGRKWLVG